MGKLLTTAEVAEMLRTTRGNLANMRSRAEGPDHIRQRRKILYDADDIREYLERRKVRTQYAPTEEQKESRIIPMARKFHRAPRGA
jgi:hypothetical protein